MKLAALLAAVAVSVPSLAPALPYGNDTLIIYQHTGGAPVNLFGDDAIDLGFTVPDSGSGAFGATVNGSQLALGSSAYVQAIGNNICKCVGVGAYVNAISVAQEVFNIPGPVGGQGYLVYDMALSGSAVGTATGNGQFFNGPVGNVRVEAAGFAASDVTAAGLGGATYHPPAQRFASASPVTIPVRVEVPFAFNQPTTVWLALAAIVEAGASDGSVSAIVDYANTLNILGLQVVDAQHQPVATGPIVGLSGTVYPVPEPGTALFASLALLAVLSRRVTR